MIKITRLVPALLLLPTSAFAVQLPTIDSVLVQREIEVMKSILSTTLSFVEKDAALGLTSGPESGYLDAYRDWARNSENRIEGFYLVGQGTVMRISLPRLPSGETKRLAALERKLAKVKKGLDGDLHFAGAQLQLLEHDLGLILKNYELMEDYSEALEMASELADYASELEEASSSQKREEWEAKVQRRVEEYEKELKTQQERLEEFEKRAEDYRKQIRNALIKAVANHGDSLSHLKPNEYLNLMLIESRGHPWDWSGHESAPSARVLSVKKSDIGEYRRNQITMEQFESRVLQY
jgi:hypothetical protein